MIIYKRREQSDDGALDVDLSISESPIWAGRELPMASSYCAPASPPLPSSDTSHSRQHSYREDDRKVSKAIAEAPAEL